MEIAWTDTAFWKEDCEDLVKSHSTQRLFSVMCSPVVFVMLAVFLFLVGPGGGVVVVVVRIVISCIVVLILKLHSGHELLHPWEFW